MKQRTGCAVLVLIMAVLAGTVCGAAEMELRGPYIVSYDFDGSTIEIPVSLSGSDAVLQLVIVESMDWDIPPWMQDEVPTPEERFIQGLDPLVYVAPQVHCQEGDNTVTWYQRDMGDRLVPPGWYRYYVLAFVPGSVSESLDYGIEHRSEIYASAAAIVSGKITGPDMQPVYPLVHFTDTSVTSAYATVNLSNSFWLSIEEPFTDGDEIGVFSPGGDLVGAYLQYPRLFYPGSFRVYGDDPATPEIDGMREDEPMTFVIWDYQTDTELPARATFSTADSLYESGAKYTLESLHIIDETAVSYAPPAPFILFQNNPNPANPTTTISFTLPEAGHVTVDVFNVAGQKVDTLVNDFMDTGRHSVVWNGSDFSSGVYFYTVQAGEFSKTMKMTLLK